MSSIREVAEKVVDMPEPSNKRFMSFDLREWKIRLVEKALRDERTRAVRIIEDHQAQDKCEDNCWTTIKAAIRKED